MGTPAIDLAVYRELEAASGAEFLVDLVETFLEETPVILAALRKSRLDGAANDYRRAAHSLKSNGNTFGAHDLADLAREIELKGFDADATQDLRRLSALEAEYAKVATALKALAHG